MSFATGAVCRNVDAITVLLSLPLSTTGNQEKKKQQLLDMQEAFQNSKDRKASELEKSPNSYVSLPDIIPERMGSSTPSSTIVPSAGWIIVNPFNCPSDAKDTIVTARVVYHPRITQS